MRAYAFVTNARELTQLKNRRFLSFLDIKCSQKATLVQGTYNFNYWFKSDKTCKQIVLRGPRGPRDPKVPKGPSGSRGPRDPKSEKYQILDALPAQQRAASLKN